MSFNMFIVRIKALRTNLLCWQSIKYADSILYNEVRLPKKTGHILGANKFEYKLDLCPPFWTWSFTHILPECD